KITKLVVYASDQTHSCVEKAAKLVGIPPRNFRVLATTSDTDFAMSPKTLREAMDADIAQELVPLYVCATIGTTPSGAVDPVNELGHVASTFGAWLHVDAAYAGSACICPEYRHYLNGVELADSVSMNPHKWLLTNMDCTCLWLKNPTTLVECLSSKPEYLRNKASESGNVVDYKDWQISLSRRFRALKLWIVLRQYGSDYLMCHIRNGIELAEYLESLIYKNDQFELLVPRKFSLVCFRLKPQNGEDGVESNARNLKLLEALNSSGQAYMTHAVIGGAFAIRCAIGGVLTQKWHIDELWMLILDKVKMLLFKYN
ncbi:Tryptophan decarboxylase TDC1, partial [Bienertia sinuspersici]